MYKFEPLYSHQCVCLRQTMEDGTVSIRSFIGGGLCMVLNPLLFFSRHILASNYLKIRQHFVSVFLMYANKFLLCTNKQNVTCDDSDEAVFLLLDLEAGGGLLIRVLQIHFHPPTTGLHATTLTLLHRVSSYTGRSVCPQ